MTNLTFIDYMIAIKACEKISIFQTSKTTQLPIFWRNKLTNFICKPYFFWTINGLEFGSHQFVISFLILIFITHYIFPVRFDAKNPLISPLKHSSMLFPKGKKLGQPVQHHKIVEASSSDDSGISSLISDIASSSFI